MDRYDPLQTPNAAEWLELDEQERTLLVKEHHRRTRIKLPNLTLHATIHVVVENQLAANDGPVVRALARLMKERLSRHDAIHAIGTAVAEHIFDALNDNYPADAMHARYYAAVERLTAAKWRIYDDG